MKQPNYNRKFPLENLISEYEAMSQTGTVGFLEEEAFQKLIDYYENERLLNKALEVTEHALTQYHYTAGFYARKAALLLKARHLVLAQSAIDKAEALDPGSISIRLLRVEAYCSLRYYKEALSMVAELKQNAKTNEHLAEAYLSEAHIYQCQERYPHMFEALKQALLANPNHPAAYRRMQFAMELSGQYEASINLYKELIDIDPYNAKAWYFLGYAHTCTYSYPQAIDAFEYAYLIDKSFEYAYRSCADACILAGEYQRALKCLEEALEHIEPDADMYVSIGLCYEELQDYVKAQHFYQKATKLNPLHDDAYYHMGQCFSKLEKWKSAISAYKKATAINNRQEEYIAALAEAYFQAREDKKAMEMFQQATETAPEQSQYWIRYASFLMATGQGKEAIDVLEEAMNYAFGTELTYCHSAFLFILGHRQEALRLLCEALHQNFSLHTAIFDLAPSLETDTEVLTTIANHQPV